MKDWADGQRKEMSANRADDRNAEDGAAGDGEDGRTHALSDILNRLEGAIEGKDISVAEVVETLGHSSFASVMLMFSLISTSPASGIPGVTALVAILVFILVAQMLFGRESLWLPDFVMRQRLESKKLRKGIDWIRKPVRFVERFLRPRLTFLFRRPWRWLPLVLILGLTLFMPVMEIVPTSGSIASAVIAFYAASLLTRDGALALIAFAILVAVPVSVWYFY